MTDIPLIKRISAVIDNLFATETQFTLLDVSNAVKADGGPFVRHTEIRDASKPILDIIMKHNSVYEVHQIDVTTSHGPDKADLYTPYFIDADEYDKTSQVAAKPAVKVSPVASAPTPVVAASVQITNVPDVAKRARAFKLVTLRSDGSLNIPKVLFEEAGFISGDGVAIIDHPNSISIVAGGERSLSDNGDFRISKTALNNSNLNGNKIYVCAFSDKIVIAEK